MDEKMRLDKFIASFSDLSRKEAKKAIRAGQVLVDGDIIQKEDIKVGIHQVVCLNGMVLQAESYVYYMLNKPQNVISATKDTTEITVTDLIEGCNREIFPIGRLDKDTMGLLFLTDDGELAHRLLSPKYHVEKKFF